jgi:hypothetical protein
MTLDAVLAAISAIGASSRVSVLRVGCAADVRLGAGHDKLAPAP